MPRRKGEPKRAPNGANPEQFRLDVPKGYSGPSGRLQAAAAKQGRQSAADWAREALEAALKAAGV